MRQVRITGSSFLSVSAAAAVPTVLALYWPLYTFYPNVASLVLRPTMLATALFLGVLWSRMPVTGAENRLAKVFGVLCLVLLVPTLTGTNIVTTGGEWIKLCLICGFCLCMCRGLRQPLTAKVTGYLLMWGSVAIALFIVYFYVQHMGLTLPTYREARIFKGFAERTHIPLNPIAFSCLFAYICALCLIKPSKFVLSVGLLLVLISSVFTGSRMPPIVVAASGVILLLAQMTRSRNFYSRATGWVAAVAIILGIGATFYFANSRDISTVTEGRWDLWKVAGAKFVEQPIAGYGYRSWRDDLVSRLPGDYSLTKTLAEQIAGGYHNEYMTALAEQGLLGTAAVMGMFFFLLKSSAQLAFRRSLTWRNGKWALFACLFLMLRALVEVPGLFGYAQEPADFTAYLFMAIVVSRFSVEEDYVRLVTANDASERVRSARAEMRAGLRMGRPAPGLVFSDVGK